MKVEIINARKRFGRVEALKGVDLKIGSGQRVALIGPNGSGKSTLIRALLGLIECEGTVLLDGRSPWRDRVEVAKRFAYVPQVAPALGATVAEIVGLATATRGLEREAVKRCATRLDLDLDEIWRRPFRNLSGGMKQKALLALAFAAEPRLLVMDEPTASLDAHAREKFFELYRSLDPGVTVLLCSHRLEEHRSLTSEVVELSEGRVLTPAPAAVLPLRVVGGVS